VIQSFQDKATERVFNGERVRRFGAEVQKAAQRKLEMIHFAAQLDDLKVPPGNRLESLKGDRAGQWSIRINDQWRVCFVWEGGNARRVEICDYH
jgi:proteic killer suppression protein